MAATTDELRDAGTRSTTATRILELSAHPDVRVRVLCAKHPRLPTSVFDVLAADPEHAVRAALAARHGLPNDILVTLANDHHKRVRARIARRADLPITLHAELVQRGVGGQPAVVMLERRLRVPSVTLQLVAVDRFRYLAAAHGRFNARILRKAKYTTAWFTAVVAMRGRVTPTALHRLARHRDRTVQENLGRRTTLSRPAELWVAFFGGPWARAAVIDRGAVGRRTLRWFTLSHRRVVRRAVAATVTSRLCVALLSCSRRWDIRSAVAANPRATDRIVRWSIRSGWSTAFAAAQRPNLSESVARAIKQAGHPAVDLQLAANPSTPRSIVEELRRRTDPFVARMASTHPSLPLADRISVVFAADAPAWVMRRVAHSEFLPDEERDRILAWLVLGGGAGDPNFDPITCTGTPGSLGQPVDQAYLALHRLGTSISDSALWRTRALVAARGLSLTPLELDALTTDAAAEVRVQAARYERACRELHRDIDPRVTRQADHLYTKRLRSAAGRQRLRRDLVRSWRRAAVPIVIALVAAISSQTRDSSTTTEGIDLVALRQTMQTVHMLSWSGHVAVPAATPACDSAASSVWLSRVENDLVVTVYAKTSRLVVDAKAEGSGVVERVPRFIEPGTAGQVRVSALYSPSLTLVVGDDPSKPIIANVDALGLAPDPTVPDQEGDC